MNGLEYNMSNNVRANYVNDTRYSINLKRRNAWRWKKKVRLEKIIREFLY